MLFFRSDKNGINLLTFLSVAEFQKKLQAAPFWATTGCEEDKKRLLEDNSIWCQNFMKWAEKEADVLSLIEKTMKWRAEVKIYSWNTSQVGLLSRFNFFFWFQLNMSAIKLASKK